MNATEQNKITALNWSEPHDGVSTCRVNADVFATITDYSAYGTGAALIVIDCRSTRRVIHESWHEDAEWAKGNAFPVLSAIANPVGPVVSVHDVTIAKEEIYGQGWMFVARDAKGEWRTRGLCSLCLADEGVPLVESLYHKEEIVSVQVRDGVTTAVIRGS